eukprot:c29311_g1_i2 orf=484-1389(+)
MAGCRLPTHCVGFVKPAEAKRGEMMVPGIKEIRDGLFIGDMLSATRVLADPNHLGITYMLSLASSTILSSLCAVVVPSTQMVGSSEHRPVFCSLEVAKQGTSLVRMSIPLNDNPDQDILPALRPCLDFINEARRRSGAVLVHCVAGVSRSATVITAYLMKTERLPLTAALESLRQKQRKASPNSGFLRQLKVFEESGFSRDNFYDGEIPSSKQKAASDERLSQLSRIKDAEKSSLREGILEHVRESNLLAEEPGFPTKREVQTTKFNFPLVFGMEEALLRRHVQRFGLQLLVQGNSKCLST